MAITFERVIQQALNRLGAVLGATAALAETNYDAPPTTSTVIGPEFTPGMIEDALAATLGEIVEAIASTPHHPERQRFASVTASLANLASIPQVDSGGTARIIGVPGFIRDAANGRALKPRPLDEIDGFNEYSAIYSAADLYLYVINGGRIEHTRTNVVIEVCVFTRPTTFTGAIALDDWHEGGLVAGTVVRLAPKESLFAELHATAKLEWDAHLAEIRNYGNPALYSTATPAPSTS